MCWKNTVCNGIRKIVRAHEGLEISGEMSLTQDIGLNSLQIVELMEYLEHRLECKVSPEDWFVNALSGETSTIDSLIGWLDENNPELR